MPVTIKPHHVENLTWNVGTLEGGIALITNAQMQGLVYKYLAKYMWVHIVPHNITYSYGDALVENVVQATAGVSVWGASRPPIKAALNIWTIFAACVAGLGLLSLLLKG